MRCDGYYFALPSSEKKKKNGFSVGERSKHRRFSIFPSSCGTTARAVDSKNERAGNCPPPILAVEGRRSAPRRSPDPGPGAPRRIHSGDSRPRKKKKNHLNVAKPSAGGQSADGAERSGFVFTWPMTGAFPAACPRDPSRRPPLGDDDEPRRRTGLTTRRGPVRDSSRKNERKRNLPRAGLGSHAAD